MYIGKRSTDIEICCYTDIDLCDIRIYWYTW